MSAFTIPQEKQVRAIVAEMIGQALRGADARPRVASTDMLVVDILADRCTVSAPASAAADLARMVGFLRDAGFVVDGGVDA